MTQTELKQKISDGDPEALFTVLMAKMKERGMEAQQKVMAHVREVSGHSTLVAYNSNGETPEGKAAMYRLLIQAVVKGDYSKLSGRVPSGQAPAEPPSVPQDEPKQPAGCVDTPKGRKKAPEPVQEQAPKSWKLGVKTRGDKDWSYNGVRLATKADAETYGSELAGRWLAVESWEAHPSDEAVTYHIVDGRAQPLPDPTVMPEPEPTPEPEPVTELAPRSVTPEPPTNCPVIPDSCPPPVDTRLLDIARALQVLIPPPPAPVQVQAAPKLDESMVEAVVRRLMAEFVTAEVKRQVHAKLTTLLKVMDRRYYRNLMTLSKTLVDEVPAGERYIVKTEY